MNVKYQKRTGTKLEHIKRKLYQGKPLKDAYLEYALGVINTYVIGLLTVDDKCLDCIACKLKNDEVLNEHELRIMDAIILLEQSLLQ